MKRVLSSISTLSVLIASACGLLPGTQDYLLAEPGPYHVGLQRMILYEDASRENRKIFVSLWYPAEVAPEAYAREPAADAGPDRSGAPYPLIISSTQIGFVFAQHMVSHGFAVLGLNNQGPKEQWGDWLVDYPLDILFALDQVAAHPPEGMEGMLAAEKTGFMGYSFDGYNALAVSGARVDPEYYRAQCQQPASDLPVWWVGYICTPARNWEAFVSHAGPELTGSEGGLWQAMTDDRIRAVMPMAPEGAWLFGERGLAAVEKPVLIIAATADTINLYEEEAGFIYENLGTPDKGVISFLDQTHYMIDDLQMVARMKHFAVAFFGYHLQGKSEYADYFSRQFVRGHAGLDWGIQR
jgi:predicted dienelactone hydrolase